MLVPPPPSQVATKRSLLCSPPLRHAWILTRALDDPPRPELLTLWWSSSGTGVPAGILYINETVDELHDESALDKHSNPLCGECAVSRCFRPSHPSPGAEKQRSGCVQWSVLPRPYAFFLLHKCPVLYRYSRLSILLFCYLMHQNSAWIDYRFPSDNRPPRRLFRSPVIDLHKAKEGPLVSLSCR